MTCLRIPCLAVAVVTAMKVVGAPREVEMGAVGTGAMTAEGWYSIPHTPSRWEWLLLSVELPRMRVGTGHGTAVCHRCDSRMMPRRELGVVEVMVVLVQLAALVVVEASARTSCEGGLKNTARQGR